MFPVLSWQRPLFPKAMAFGVVKVDYLLRFSPDSDEIPLSRKGCRDFPPAAGASVSIYALSRGGFWALLPPSFRLPGFLLFFHKELTSVQSSCSSSPLPIDFVRCVYFRSYPPLFPSSIDDPRRRPRSTSLFQKKHLFKRVRAYLLGRSRTLSRRTCFLNQLCMEILTPPPLDKFTQRPENLSVPLDRGTAASLTDTGVVLNYTLLISFCCCARFDPRTRMIGPLVALQGTIIELFRGSSWLSSAHKFSVL